MDDCRKRQTSTASPAEPGDLPWALVDVALRYGVKMVDEASLSSRHLPRLHGTKSQIAGQAAWVQFESFELGRVDDRNVENYRRPSRAAKMPSHDSTLFPLRFTGVRPRDARDFRGAR